MHGDKVKGLYQQLIRLLKAYRTAPLSQQHVKDSLLFAEALIETVKTIPDPLISELSIHRGQLPQVVNLTLTSCLMAALLGARNKFNDSCCQQIVCAAITLYSFNQSQIEQFLKTAEKPKERFKTAPQLASALHKANLDVWASCYDSFSEKQGKWFLQPFGAGNNNKSLTLLSLAHGLSMGKLRCPPNGNFAKVLKKGFQSVSGKQAELLMPLLNYPGLTPPGSIVKIVQGGTSIVLSCLEDGLLVKSLKAPLGEPHLPKKVSLSSIKALSAPRVSNSFSQLDNYWDKDWQDAIKESYSNLNPHAATFRLDRPPAVLIEVQKHLQLADIDFNTLAELISNEPSLATHLKDSASQSSKSKLPVQDVKHGLMMHGYERTNSLLVQQALLLRLNQNYFPLQENFVQFTRLRCHLAASIIALKDKSLTEQANCLASFASSGLFTIAALKGIEKWHISDKKPFDIRYMVDMSHQQALHDNAIKLAEAWHQTPQMIMALRNHLLFPEHMPKHKTAGKLAVSLGLSLMLARQLYFGEQSHCSEGANYRKQSLKYLGISQTQLTDIVNQSQGYCHSYWAISD